MRPGGTSTSSEEGGAGSGESAPTFGSQAGHAAQTAPTSIREFVPATQDVACDFCGSTDFVFFSDKMRNGINLKTVLCKCCALAQTNPQPTAESLATFYGQFYHLFHHRAGVDDSYVAKSNRMAEQRFRLVTRFLDPAARASLLEVGPGAGAFLTRCKEGSAWQRLGVEPGAESYRWCAGQGLNVVHEGFEQFESAERFSLIVAFNVMDHLRSPRAFLEKCHALLAEDGLLSLEVVNFNRFGVPLAQYLQFPLLYSLTLISLLNYLGQTGFQPVYLDETAGDDAVGTLKVVCRRLPERGGSDFIRIDLDKHLSALNRKDRVYRLAEWLPRFSIFARLRSVLKSA